MPTFEIIASMVRISLAEDIGTGDISALLLPSSLITKAVIIARQAAVVCGIPWVNEIFNQIDPNVELTWYVVDGQPIAANQPWVEIQGAARSILTGERCALNWLQTLSATATQTAQYKALLADYNVKLLDTRKTIPGLRYAQKYAVRCSGADNHRMGLYDAYLIKENHIISAGSISLAISQARQLFPLQTIEIEVETLEELKQALAAEADIILLDNFSFEDMETAVAINQGRAELEVSGNVNLSTIQQIAATGVDRISVGALTKHIQAIDLSLRFAPRNT